MVQSNVPKAFFVNKRKESVTISKQQYELQLSSQALLSAQCCCWWEDRKLRKRQVMADYIDATLMYSGYRRCDELARIDEYNTHSLPFEVVPLAKGARQQFTFRQQSYYQKGYLSQPCEHGLESKLDKLLAFGKGRCEAQTPNLLFLRRTGRIY